MVGSPDRPVEDIYLPAIVHGNDILPTIMVHIEYFKLYDLSAKRIRSSCFAYDRQSLLDEFSLRIVE